jgi:Carbohydrate esterase, sialic acid-specific acetylesterase
MIPRRSIPGLLLSLVSLALGHGTLSASELTLTAPLDYQVVQRSSPGKGLLRIAGELTEEEPAKDVMIEARFVGEAVATGWQRAGGSIVGKKLSGTVEAPAGGWWTLEVRLTHEGKELAAGRVGKVGVGEVFVVAGQSNSANHGEEKQTPQTGLVASFDGKTWCLADDPQPGASGNGGSFLPPLGDALAAKLGVPIGFVACGIGATSVREWLPEGATFPNPPTIEGRVEKRPDGLWMSKGAAYQTFLARMKPLGLSGFRAVLWHQGESDANQKDATRTLPGALYRQSLETVIRESRHEIGWEVPWFVAQASYHVPDDEGSADIRAAQASLARDGIALAGPDSDALKGDLRERNGQGVHFSGKGLREHGLKWAETILPWIERQWTEPRTVPGGTEWSDFSQLPASHSISWVGANVTARDTKSWDGVLDEAKWGTPSPDQVVSRNWDWKISDEAWAAAVKEKGAGSSEEVRFDLWLPEGIAVVKGMVVMSGHGSGESLFYRADLRALATELGLGLFKFTGNPLQRGFWPQSLLFDRLRKFGESSGHPEVGHAPLFLYGHSNGTGFSAVFPSYEPGRVWGWVSMRPGITFQVYQPGAAQVPGLVIFGEDDSFLARPSREENLAVIPALRKKHGALWNFVVEPKSGHGPGEKTWPLVYSFLRHTFAARVPGDADLRKGPVNLTVPTLESGHLGQNWDAAKGGYQNLMIAPYAGFSGDKTTASWLVNAGYAADWQAFQRVGGLGSGR